MTCQASELESISRQINNRLGLERTPEEKRTVLGLFGERYSASKLHEGGIQNIGIGGALLATSGDTHCSLTCPKSQA